MQSITWRYPKRSKISIVVILFKSPKYNWQSSGFCYYKRDSQRWVVCTVVGKGFQEVLCLIGDLSQHGKKWRQTKWRSRYTSWRKKDYHHLKLVSHSLCNITYLGVILRDSFGVAQVRWLAGNKILRILKSKGLAPDIPEDLYQLVKKAVAIRKHLGRNAKDKDSKFRLILVESRIQRLARYYKRKRVLPPNWKYDSSTASTLIAWFIIWQCKVCGWINLSWRHVSHNFTKARWLVRVWIDPLAIFKLPYHSSKYLNIWWVQYILLYSCCILVLRFACNGRRTPWFYQFKHISSDFLFLSRGWFSLDRYFDWF